VPHHSLCGIVRLLEGLSLFVTLITHRVAFLEIGARDFNLLRGIVKGKLGEKVVNGAEPIGVFKPPLAILINPPIVRDNSAYGNEFPTLRGTITVEIVRNTHYKAIYIGVAEMLSAIPVHNKASFQILPLVLPSLIPTEVIEQAVPKGKPLVKIVLNRICTHNHQLYCFLLCLATFVPNRSHHP